MESSIPYVETAVDAQFQEEFVAALHIPHAGDRFPHLEGLIPKVVLANPNSRKRRKRQKRNTDDTDQT